ncbi:MAG: hypothetical protein V4551_11055 [Pseudomonadota bacterium]
MSSKDVGIPDLDTLPAHALLTRAQLQRLTGLANITLRVWSSQGRGPKLTRIEGNPRYMVRDVKAWLEGRDRSVEAAQ